MSYMSVWKYFCGNATGFSILADNVSKSQLCDVFVLFLFDKSEAVLNFNGTTLE